MIEPSAPTISIAFGGGTTEAYFPIPLQQQIPSRVYPDAVSLGGRPFTINTSFEPYRREAFRHRTILPQRQSINFENVAGYGTLNTEGLWRRDQLDWSEGAGQQFLDRKTTSSASRFLSSQGVNPWIENQLTLLHDTALRVPSEGGSENVKAISVNASACFIDGTAITFYQSNGTGWDSPSTSSVTWPGDTPDTVFDICTDGHLVYIATTSGIFTVDTDNLFTSGVWQTSIRASLYLATGLIENYQAQIVGFTAPSGANNLTTDSVPSLVQVGMAVIGTNIPASTTVTSVGPNGLTLSNPTSGVIASTDALTFNVTENYTITAYTMVRVCNDTLIAAASQDHSPSTGGAVPYNVTSANCLLALTTVPPTTVPQASQVLMIHPNPNWVWSCATGGATQIYVGGFSNGGSGAVYRSSMTGATSVASVNQPFQLNYPVQTLPLEMAEIPTCLYSCLNFIFLGTNLGIRMCQTLSIYDPSATATGDLKAGPLAPNLLQPVLYPVTGIVGFGRFVYFTWGAYGGQSKGPNGIGRLDLTTNIGGDPLSPAYASDLMDNTLFPNLTTWVDLDPLASPGIDLANQGALMFSVTSSGVVSVDPDKYVAAGTINSGAITYGISDPKIPVQMDMSADLVSSQGIGIVLDMFDPSGSDIIIQPPNYQGSQVTVPNGARSERINVTLTLHSSSDQTKTPILYRYTLKSWPAATSETAITPVVTFGNNLSGFQVEFSDPYENFWYLQQLLQNQTIVPYVEGPLSANVVVQELDWLPAKLQDNYEQGFIGDCVIYLKTIGGYQYNPIATTFPNS